ncbi:hypothetical protein MOQ72_17905 [Saccharopolyspora sp. K220]|uniref:hypothetical protein n=1 Tax=Saccharopolyspora soli TaxID=2926618 RepID=UPI001F567390|nr:hypothetical protein [Saccharopolyspora soli]MCI2419322.1 hypothetical protein [Saccharopolyspora soli]
MLNAQFAPSPEPRPVANLRATGHLKRNDLVWTPAPWSTVLDHYRVYGMRGTGKVPIGPETLLAKTPYPHYEHRGLDAGGERWTYQIVVIDAAGSASITSNPVEATSTRSVTVSGSPIAIVGTFDGKGLEMALSPNGYSRYPTTFPDDVDFRHGADSASSGWSYLQPGPADAWAGRRNHLFRLRFDLSTVPAQDVDLALWLIDSHASIPGSAVLSVNGTTVDRLAFALGATKGSTIGDSTVPGSPLKPSYIERPLARELFRQGGNVLELFKDDGSWIAYDAIGVYARR